MNKNENEKQIDIHNQTRKLSDEQFLETLLENGGLYSQTARAIQEKYNIKFSRQAVRERAQNFQDDVLECRDELADLAEKNMKDFLTDEDKSVKYKATVYTLNSIGKTRGYGKGTAANENPEPDEAWEIDGKLFRF